MKNLRRMEVNFAPDDILNAGDQLTINLGELGTFTATAQARDNVGTLVLFDECVVERHINNNGRNDGGFDMSDLCKWLKTEFLSMFPAELRNRITDISIPTYGQIFGHDIFYNRYMEPDSDGQFPLMATRKNRIAHYKNDPEWWWLKNATKYSVSSDYFACVDYFGDEDSSRAYRTCGVRPVFLLV